MKNTNLVVNDLPIIVAVNESVIPEEDIFTVNLAGDIYGVIGYLSIDESGSGRIGVPVLSNLEGALLYREALKNTEEHLPAMAMTISLFDVDDDHGPGFVLLDIMKNDVDTLRSELVMPSFVSITNKITYFGSTGIFLPGVAKKISELFDGEDYFILFLASSQVICQKIEGRFIEDFVRESIEQLSDPNDVLSKKLYKYSAKDDDIIVV